MGTIVLLDVMGGVALLLWGLHMVHSGILRAFGLDLRQLLSTALGNRFAAFAAGLTWAAHSSVAIVLLIMSLAYSHFVTPTARARARLRRSPKSRSAVPGLRLRPKPASAPLLRGAISACARSQRSSGWRPGRFSGLRGNHGFNGLKFSDLTDLAPRSTVSDGGADV
jgi:hypothetical protein